MTCPRCSHDAKKRLLLALPPLRKAVRMATARGTPRIAILTDDGALVATLDAASFVADLCDALGAAHVNTSDEDLDVDAATIIQTFGGSS